MNHILKAIKEYIFLRNQLGFKIVKTKNILVQFGSFLRAKKASYITTDLAVAFATQNSNITSMQWAARRLSIIRRFALYLKATDLRTEIPPLDLLPHSSYRRKTPYIYSEWEIEQVLQCCMKMQSKHELKPHTYFTLFGLLVVTGMRKGEAIELTNECVDMNKGIIEIREAKNRKTRHLPLDASTIDVLREYKKHRDRCFPNIKSPFFFVSSHGTKLVDSRVGKVFIWVSKQIGLRQQTEHSGPRLMDLRHTFAVTTITRWYQKGFNIDHHMQLLSIYLGHSYPAHTYWYLTTTPELLSLVTLRLEKYLGEV